jgi:hypothetical protein
MTGRRLALGSIVLGILIGIAGLLVFGVTGTNAQDGGTGRYKIVETTSTEYLWNMVSMDGGVICQVTVSHENVPSDTEGYLACKDQILAIPTPTSPAGAVVTPSTGFSLSNFFKNVRWQFVEKREVSTSTKIAIPDLIVNLTVPDGPLIQPYVIITGFEPMTDYEIVGIHGMVEGVEFSCVGSRCEVPVLTDSTITYWAKSSFGDESAHQEAEVRVSRLDSGYSVTVTTTIQYQNYGDSCGDIWGISPSSDIRWTEFPAAPEELNTSKTLHYLATQLIMKGAVSTKDCPGNGFFYTGSPNDCGLERSTQAMYEWQNTFDSLIWSSSRTVGIPPILLKSMIEQETQFWPANMHNGEDEFGLGQINQLGADVALRWDDELFAQVCSGVLSNCNTPYASLSNWEQAMLRGALTRMVNAECSTCKYGIDIARAEQSIPLIAETLRANCSQTKFILNSKGAYATNYEDMWRFTMVSYHSGYQCLLDAVSDTRASQQPLNWDYLSLHLNCEGAKDYVENLWEKLVTFQADKTIRTVSNQGPQILPTFYPTPSPTPYISNPLASTIHVQAYQDNNNNYIADPDEWINDATVQLDFFDGTKMSKALENGEAYFDTIGRQTGLAVTISIPDLYRVYKTKVLKEGELLIIFRIEPPSLPGELP